MPDNDVIRHPFADAVKVLERALSGQTFTVEQSIDAREYVATLEQENARLRAALQVFVDRAGKVSTSTDPLYCIWESDVTQAELDAARAALAERGSK